MLRACFTSLIFPVSRYRNFVYVCGFVRKICQINFKRLAGREHTCESLDSQTSAGSALHMIATVNFSKYFEEK